MLKKSLNLAFNTSSIAHPLTGVGRYTFELGRRIEVYSMLKASFFRGYHWENEIKVSHSPVTGLNIKNFVKRYVPFSYQIRDTLQNYCFTKNLSLKRLDLYHEPNAIPQPFSGPMVLTVHDLSWIRFPETHPIERVRFLNKNFEKGLNRSTQVITDSIFIKEELVSVFGIDRKKVSVVYLGAESSFFPRTESNMNNTLSKYGLKNGMYWLSIGTLEPRKNISLLLKAFFEIPKKIRQMFPLVIVGPTGWLSEALESQISELVFSGEVLRLGYVDRSELPIIMSGAKALIYPSKYEGFGLPVLESMCCGTPVISSNVSSMPEICSKGGILIDPDDVHQLKNAILELVNNQDLEETLSKEGLLRSKSFSWDNCFRNTIKVYQKATAT